MIMDEEKNNRKTKLPRVRRRLFVDDDNNESRKTNNDNMASCLFEGLHEDVEKAKEKWNFDFVNDKPLPGRWLWVGINEEFPDDTKTDLTYDNQSNENSIKMEDANNGNKSKK